MLGLSSTTDSFSQLPTAGYRLPAFPDVFKRHPIQSEVLGSMFELCFRKIFIHARSGRPDDRDDDVHLSWDNVVDDSAGLCK